MILPFSMQVTRSWIRPHPRLRQLAREPHYSRLKPLHLANRRQPLTGPDVALRYGLRLGGILTAIRMGRVGNRRVGKQLHGHHGGNAVKRYRLQHLRRLPQLGREAQQSRRDAQRKQQEYDSRPATAAPPLRSTRPWEDQGPDIVWNLDDLD